MTALSASASPRSFFPFATALAVVSLGLTTVVRAQCPEAVGADVIAGDLNNVANFATRDDIDALSFGAVTCNVGDADVNVSAITNDHDILTQNLYRLKDYGGWFAIEQVGMSWVKHGFCALSQSLCCTTCVPTDCTSIGIGCSSPTSAGIAGSAAQLGPRWEIDAFTSQFPFPASNPPIETSTARRLQVAVADIEPTASSTTRYFAELHVLAPADAQAANGENNASYRELDVTGSGGNFAFSFQGTTQRKRPGILAWKDVDPGVDVHEIRVPGEGQLMLASRAVPCGGGTWHYEYALYNMNSHDSVRSFSVPVAAGGLVTDVGFHDVVYRDGDGDDDVSVDGTDWPSGLSGGALSWEVVGNYTPPNDVNHNALRWGTTYNFRFKADRGPALGTLTLETYRTETSFSVGDVVVPLGAPLGVAFCDVSDGALASCPCANPGDPDTGCDLAQATGGVQLAASGFEPDGSGGGQATFAGTGFPAGSSPAAVLIRSLAREEPPAVFGDGLRCVGLPVVRIRSGFAAGGTVQLNVTHGAGAGTFAYQAWFRNTPAMFCDPSAAFNLSNGFELVW